MIPTRQILIRDTWDSDIFHVGYAWHSEGLRGTIHRTAATIHIDDIESIFGADIHETAKELVLGGKMDIEITAKVVE